MITWEITTDSKLEPVTVTEAKDHLRVDHSNDDSVILSLIKSARYRLEAATGLAFFTQTRQLRLPCFPYKSKILLPGYPVQSVTHIKYYDTGGTQQTWSNSEYTLRDAKPNYIQLNYNEVYPVHRSKRDEIEIEYIAGETSTVSIDPRVIQAIKLDVELNYDDLLLNRDARARIIYSYDALVSQLQIGEDFLEYGSW